MHPHSKTGGSLLLAAFFACSGSEPPAEPLAAEASTAASDSAISPAAWIGDWVMGERILTTDGAGQLQLMQGGEVVMSGPMSGDGLQRSAPLDGCGATLKLSGVGGDITVELSGPECAIEFAGTYINTISP